MYIYYTFLHISIHTLYLHSDYKQTRPLQKAEKRSGGGRVKRGNGLRERKTEREVGERVNEGEAAGKHAKRRRLFPAHSLPPLHTDTTERVNTRRLALKLAQ